MTYVRAAAMQKLRPISNTDKSGWNDFINFLDKKGMKGNPALDNRNTNLSQQLFNEYKSQNPNFSLTYDQIPQVQADLQNYRSDLVNKWKANPSIIPDAKSEDDIMPNLSDTDGWLGSKTSMHKYPVAMITNTNGAVQNFGTDLDKYNAAAANYKK